MSQDTTKSKPSFDGDRSKRIDSLDLIADLHAKRRPFASSHYTVKRITTIAQTRDLQARLHTLAPADAIPWHFHRNVTDWYFCLAGSLHIETRAPQVDKRITVGGYYSIPPYTGHRISNGGDEDCRFVLLQGVGHYDFNDLHAVASDVVMLGGRG